MQPVSHRGIGARALSLRTGRLAAAIVALHVSLALAWSLAVPIGEGPDEPGHFNYALFLAREGRLPVQQADPAAGDVPGEGHQPPLAYWLMQPALRWLPEEQRVLEMGANPRFRWNGGEEPNAFFRSSRDIWPYQGVARAWHLARAISALLGGATITLVEWQPNKQDHRTAVGERQAPLFCQLSDPTVDVLQRLLELISGGLQRL